MLATLRAQRHMEDTIADYESKLERRRIGAEQHTQILEVGSSDRTDCGPCLTSTRVSLSVYPAA